MMSFLTFVLLAVGISIAFITFWVILILNKKDVELQITLPDGTLDKRKYGKIIREGIPKTEKIKILDKDKRTIPYWIEYQKTRLGEKPLLRLYKDENGDYYPIKTAYNMDAQEIEEVKDDKDMKYWHTLEIREANDRFKRQETLIDKLAPVIGYIIAGLVVFLAVYFAADVAKKGMDSTIQYEQKTLDLRIAEVDTLNRTTQVLEELKPILIELSKRNNGQFVGVVN